MQNRNEIDGCSVERNYPNSEDLRHIDLKDQIPFVEACNAGHQPERKSSLCITYSILTYAGESKLTDRVDSQRGARTQNVVPTIDSKQEHSGGYEAVGPAKWMDEDGVGCEIGFDSLTLL